MNTVVGIAVGVALTITAGLVLIGARYELTPKSLKFPFLEFDVQRFSDLSPFIVFDNVSRAAISPSKSARDWLQGRKIGYSSVILIHLAWQLVCDTFVKRFSAYPDEENVRLKIGELGSQNAEFIITYEKLYSAAVRFKGDIEMDFAREYFLRAPSLAQRISSEDVELQELFERAAATLEALD